MKRKVKIKKETLKLLCSTKKIIKFTQFRLSPSEMKEKHPSGSSLYKVQINKKTDQEEKVQFRKNPKLT